MPRHPSEEAAVIERPRIVRTEDRLAAVVHISIEREESHRVMGAAIAEIMAAVADQGVSPTGPVFTHHLLANPYMLDCEVGVPVAAPISAAGRVKPGRLPAALVAQTTYRGPYEDLLPAWREFEAWIAAEGLKPATNLWECYVAGPESSPDPYTWRTELNRPLHR
jgi:effector-binding domain-containing protein